MEPLTESTIRLASFAGVFLAMLVWELLAPRRVLTVKRSLRWASNLGLVALNTICARLIGPLSAVAMAELAARRHWGLFHWLEWPAWLEIVLAVVLFDLIIY